jgi:cyclohexanone monooxygenase
VAYKGTTVAGFPNLFLMTGPNTGLGHTSVVFIIESQLPYIMGGLAEIAAGRSVAVRPEAQAAWNTWLQRKLARTVWASGCQSWYQTEGGRHTVLWPGFTWAFRRRLRRFDPEAYSAQTTASA